MLESGEAQLTGREIPVTLHDSLMARLDRLGPAKEVAQVGAVIGARILLRIAACGPSDSRRRSCNGAAKLADAELIYVRGIPPEATYQFKHALIRDAAYEALLKSRRKELHRRSRGRSTRNSRRLGGAARNSRAPLDRKRARPSRRSPHGQKAGRGRRGARAFKEASESYRQALALLNMLPESPERDARELELGQSSFGCCSSQRLCCAGNDRGNRARSALAEKSGNLAQLVLR